MNHHMNVSGSKRTLWKCVRSGIMISYFPFIPKTTLLTSTAPLHAPAVSAWSAAAIMAPHAPHGCRKKGFQIPWEAPRASALNLIKSPERTRCCPKLIHSGHAVVHVAKINPNTHEFTVTPRFLPERYKILENPQPIGFSHKKEHTLKSGISPMPRIFPYTNVTFYPKDTNYTTLHNWII